MPHNSANLAVINGAKSTATAFASLPLETKIAELALLPARRRMAAILGDPQGRELVRALPATDVFWLVKELGLADSGELIEFAAPEQIAFCLDLDVWEKWTPQPERFLVWLQAIMDAGPDVAMEIIRGLDQELLILLLKQEIQVGGGLQTLSDDDESAGTWEQTFDNIYFFNFLNKEHAPQIGQFLQLLCQRDQSLFVCLLEGVKSELTADLEEVSYQFRSGRLGDYGFPELTEALAVFSYLDPDTFVPAVGKEPLIAAGFSSLPITIQGEDLLTRVLAGASASTLAELQVLFNCALVAEATPFADSDDILAVCRRVRGYLNLALEHLCAGNEAVAAQLLEQEYLKRLCQLGYSLVLRLRRQAEGLSREGLQVNHPTERALAGIMQRHPRFYRGFDKDHADGYREMRTLADLRLVAEFLDSLED